MSAENLGIVLAMILLALMELEKEWLYPTCMNNVGEPFVKIGFIISLHRECNVLGMSGRLNKMLSNHSHEVAFEMLYN